MVGVDLLAGAVVAYLIRKARRVGGRADEHVDAVLDAGTDRICELIEGSMGDDRVLSLLDEQAQAGTETERTVRRAEDAIAEKLEADEVLQRRLEALLRELEGRPGAIVLPGAGGVAAGRDVTIKADGGSVAAGVMGSVTVNPQQPDPHRA